MQRISTNDVEFTLSIVCHFRFKQIQRQKSSEFTCLFKKENILLLNLRNVEMFYYFQFRWAFFLIAKLEIFWCLLLFMCNLLITINFHNTFFVLDFAFLFWFGFLSLISFGLNRFPCKAVCQAINIRFDDLVCPK